MQEQEQDQSGKQNSLAHIAPCVIDHGTGKRAVVSDPYQFHAPRQFEFFQGLPDIFNDLYRVGFGSLDDANGNGLAFVHVSKLALFLGAHAYVCHIFDVGALAILAGDFYFADGSKVFVFRIELDHIFGAVGANTA